MVLLPLKAYWAELLWIWWSQPLECGVRGSSTWGVMSISWAWAWSKLELDKLKLWFSQVLSDLISIIRWINCKNCKQILGWSWKWLVNIYEIIQIIHEVHEVHRVIWGNLKLESWLMCPDFEARCARIVNHISCWCTAKHSKLSKLSLKHWIYACNRMYDSTCVW